MAPKPRVHEIAREFGVDSKYALRELKALGEFVKGPSSSIKPPVARKLRARLSDPNAPRPAEPPVYPWMLDAVPLLGGLPRTMPQFIDMVTTGLRDTVDGLAPILAQALEDRRLYYAPTRAGEGNGRAPLGEDELPSPSGIALVARSDREGSRINSRLLLAWVCAEGRLRLYLSEILLQRRSPSEPYAVRFGSPRHEELLSSEGRFSPPDGRMPWAFRTLVGLSRSIPVVIASEHDSEHEGPERSGKTSDSRESDDTVRLVYATRRIGSVGSSRSSDPVRRTSQWGVRGHYRNQWYPSTEEHKRIWIDEHTAGAADAPLKKRELVYVISPR